MSSPLGSVHSCILLLRRPPWALPECGLGHVDIRFAGAVGVGHDAGNHIAKKAIEEKGVFAAQIVEFRDVTRNVIVEIHSGDRGVAAIVVGAQRESAAR